MKQNYLSDFVIRETHEGGLDPAVPFKFTYCTWPGMEYVASYDGKTYTNCKLMTDGTLIVFFDNHGLAPGHLHVVREYKISDTDFKDGVRTEISKENTGIILTDGESDGRDCELSVIAAYKKGDKGDKLTYQDLTPQEIQELQKPATDAAVLANDAATAANKAAQDATASKQQADAATTLANEQANRARTEADRMVAFTTSINVSNAYPTGSPTQSNIYTLQSAINVVEERYRTVGLKCSFLTTPTEGEEWQYIGGVYNDVKNWVRTDAKSLDNRRQEIDAARNEALSRINQQKVTPDMLSQESLNLINAAGGGTITNNADGTDLASEQVDGINVIRFADRKHEPTKFNGKGRIYLRPNIVGGKNVLAQEMMSQENTVYVIRDDFDLDGKTIKIPSACSVEFDGGSLNNGLIDFNNAFLSGDVKLYINVLFDDDNEFNELSKPSNRTIHVKWFGAKGDGANDDSFAILEAVKCLHKRGSSLVFEGDKTYILGDGLQGEKHTGNAYKYVGVPSVPIVASDPANIGRKISLTFFRFSYLRIAGNGAKLKSHDNNGDCKNNRIIRLLACDNVFVENLIVDGNRQNRIQRLSDHGLVGEYKINDLYLYDSLKKVLSIKNIWEDYPNLTRDMAGGYRDVSNIEIMGGHDIVFTNVVSVNSMVDGIILGGDRTGVPTNIQFLNCRCLYNSRQGLTISSADCVKVIGGEYSYSGYLNREREESGMPPMSGIDVEADAFKSKQICIENALIDSNRMSGIVYSKDSSNVITTRCTFINSDVNTMNDTGANNEISYNKFINSSCGILQDNLNVHHNIFEFDRQSLNLSFHFDDNDCSEKAKETFTSYFCNNIINVDVSNVQISDVGYIGAFRINSNIIFKNNKFNNIYASGGNYSFLIHTREFENNIVNFDVSKHPILKGSNKYIGLKDYGSIKNNVFNNAGTLSNKLSILQSPGYTAFHNIATNTTPAYYKLLVDCNGRIDVNYDSYSYSIKFVYDSGSGNYPVIFFVDKSKKRIENINDLPIICYKYRGNLFVKVKYKNGVNYTLYLYTNELESYLSSDILQEVNDSNITSSLLLMKNGSAFINKSLSESGALELPGFSTTLSDNKTYWRTLEEKWVDAFGNPSDALKMGTTAQRPVGVQIGYVYKDTDLGKWIVWNGSAWENLDGTALA